MSETFGRITWQRGRWLVRAEPHVMMMLRRIFKRAERRGQAVAIAHSVDAAADLHWLTQRYPMTVEPADALERAVAKRTERITRLEDFVSDNYEPPEFEMQLQPRSYQAAEAQIVHEQGFLLVADDVGLGKTCTAITVCTDARCLPAVVVTLTHLPQQWRDEFAKFTPALNVHAVTRGKPYPLSAGPLAPMPDVVVLNYHKLDGWCEVLSKYAKTIIFDEAQHLRRSDSNRYRAAEAIARRCDFTLGLSATPIYNYGDEMFNILQVLKPGLLGTLSEFRTEWCVSTGQRHKIKDARAFGTWCRRNFVMIRHTRRDVARELPDVTRVVHTVESDARAIAAVEDDAQELAQIILSTAKLDKGVKMNAAERLSNVLRQATGVAKAPYVADFLEILLESEQKVLVAVWHRAVYEILSERLKQHGVVFYSGSESPRQKEASKREFVHGAARVMLISLRSGEGLNDLQRAASVVVFAELDWSPAVHEQMIGRLNRDGQETPVVAYFLVAEDGADPTMVDVLGLKREQAEGIRDPDGEMIERLEADGSRVRQLAERYIEAKA